MMSAPLRLLLRRAQAQVRHVQPVGPRQAAGLVAEVYRQVERDFGMLAPPITLHSPAPTVLAAAWMMLRETLLVEGAASRASKEAVATAVARANSCPYCFTVHGSALHELSEQQSTVDLQRASDNGASGQLREEDCELLAVALTFEYLTRMVNVFLPDSPVPAEVPRTMHGLINGILGRITVGGRMGLPGESLTLLPRSEVDIDIPWVRNDTLWGDALARSASAVDATAAAWLPPAVRELVISALSDGRPRHSEPSRSWLPARLSTLPPPWRPAGRLALLTALASYQVTSSDVSDFRAAEPEPGRLIELSSWAAMAAARAAGRRYLGASTTRQPDVGTTEAA